MSEKILLQILDEIQVMKGEQKQTNQRLDGMDKRLDSMDQRFDAIYQRLDVMDQRFERMEEKTDAVQEQTAKISEFHAEIIEKLNNKATKDDFNYLKEIVFRHDEEIYKIKSHYQSVNESSDY
ncbi:hypothetical protein [Gracilibacillus massiliensis]|uniref:hypothetical protein n=1 Tax=Gracilibacillus massiliensis TaxID=1564956 RepID=UPI00071D8451|nr:hypothetical protein [Gracilibacillus massiliensis]